MSIQIIGVADLERQLAALAEAFTEAELSEAVGEHSSVIVKRARRRAPKDTHALAEAIEVTEYSEPGRVDHVIGVDSPERGVVAVSQELGTEHHAAQPFLCPAFKSRKRTAGSKIRRRFRDRIEEQLL